MSAQSRLGIRGVVIRITSRSQDHVGRDISLKTLLTESNALQVFQTVLLGGTIHHCIPKNDISHAWVEESRLTRPAATVVIGFLGILKVPRVSTLTMQQAWVIITLVQKLEDARQDFGLPICIVLGFHRG